jgi:two-component system sensor kinase FixL
MRSRGAPRRDAEGRIIRWYGTLENVDAVKRAELQLEQMRSEMIHLSRLNAMGTMASTLAHELNQPLAAAINYIKGSQRLLSQNAGAGTDRILDAVTQAERCAVRASEIIRKLRDLVAGNSANRRWENVRRLIDDACSIALINAAELGIAWRIDLDPGVTSVLVDGIQIQQILINLLCNAVDAVTGADRREIVITSSAADGFWALTIGDSGPGVAAEMADRMFESFQTTKAHGTGIGLSISRTIAEAQGGQIQYARSVLGGAAFTMQLPLPDLDLS